MMKTYGYQSLSAALLTTFTLAACGSTLDSSAVTHAGVTVEFSAVCVDSTAQLESIIVNRNSNPVAIKSGNLPWYYDVLGSEFVARVGEDKLERKWSAPLVGRIGPITLAANERRGGLVPIAAMFPTLQAALKNGEKVKIYWKYRIDAKAVGGGTSDFDGELVLTKDPC
ncbi:MAG: hypothetical protein ABW106_14145 [Steroidobacteraceae bacterium]